MDKYNEKLKFAVWPAQRGQMQDFLLAHGYAYTVQFRAADIIFLVSIGPDPGKAGRAFDIGYFLSQMESKSIDPLPFAGGRGYAKKFLNLKTKKQNERRTILNQQGSRFNEFFGRGT